MLEHAAGDEGVVIVAPLRSDRGVAGLSTRPLTGLINAWAGVEAWESSSPNVGSIVKHAGEISATVMKYPLTGTIGKLRPRCGTFMATRSRIW